MRGLKAIRVGLLLGCLVVLIVLAMVSSLQAVGVLLSLGLLVLPAATIYLLWDSCSAMSWGGGVIGVVGAVAGLLISFWTNIPSGPAIVMVLGTLFSAAFLFGPNTGRFAMLHRRHLHEESLGVGNSTAWHDYFSCFPSTTSYPSKPVSDRMPSPVDAIFSFKGRIGGTEHK